MLPATRTPPFSFIGRLEIVPLAWSLQPINTKYLLNMPVHFILKDKFLWNIYERMWCLYYVGLNKYQNMFYVFYNSQSNTLAGILITALTYNHPTKHTHCTVKCLSYADNFDNRDYRNIKQWSYWQACTISLNQLLKLTVATKNTGPIIFLNSSNTVISVTHIK